jgi:hypothetical protein
MCAERCAAVGRGWVGYREGERPRWGPSNVDKDSGPGGRAKCSVDSISYCYTFVGIQLCPVTKHNKKHNKTKHNKNKNKIKQQSKIK